MAEAAPLSVAMIAAKLREFDEDVTVDEKAHRCDIQIGYDKTARCRMMLVVFADGSDHDILRISVYTDRRIARNGWDAAMARCNQWNMEKRWPKAFLYVDEPTVDRTGGIILNYELLLQGDVPPAILDGIISPVFTGAIDFWREAGQELDFVGE